MSKNLFIIASPLQLLNALEAKDYFHTLDNILILIYNSSLNYTDFQQKMNLIEEKDWNEIIHYDLGKIAKKKRFFEQIKLVKKLNQCTYSHLFAGDFGTIQQLLMANLKIEEIYLLDDGTASIVTYDRLKDITYFNKYKFSKKMKLLRYLLVNLNYKIKQDINFFTVYDLEPLSHINIIRHNFTYLKRTRLAECKKNNFIYLLGQNLSEVGWMDKEVYLEYLQKIINQFDINIIYKPHRSEEITSAYKHLISEKFSIDYDISQGPIEVSLINDKIYPSIVISFFSSALFNLDKIFDDTIIYSVRINENDLINKGNNTAIIKSCYDFLRKTRIKFIDL